MDGDDKAVVRLHVQPGAGRTAVVGTHGDALKIRVAAPPEGGRANEACVALLAEVFGVKPAAVALTAGDKSRAKKVTVTGHEADEVKRLLELALEDAARAPGSRR